MSIGALHELLRANLQRFAEMVKPIPNSQRKEVVLLFRRRVKILEDGL